MTQEKAAPASGQGSKGQESLDSARPDDTTPLRDLVMALLEAQTEASKRIAALEREVKSLRSKQAGDYDWGQEVLREPERWVG